jgi:hypothetical protein
MSASQGLWMQAHYSETEVYMHALALNTNLQTKKSFGMEQPNASILSISF